MNHKISPRPSGGGLSIRSYLSHVIYLIAYHIVLFVVAGFVPDLYDTLDGYLVLDLGGTHEEDEEIACVDAYDVILLKVGEKSLLEGVLHIVGHGLVVPAGDEDTQEACAGLVGTVAAV